MRRKWLLFILFVFLMLPTTFLTAKSNAVDVHAADHGSLHQEIVDGKKYFIYTDGTHLTGWFNLTSTWRLYLNPNDDGAAVVGYQKIADGEYVFNKDGLVNFAYGTPIIDGKKYWVTGDGTIRTGWQNLLNWKLYFDPELKYARTGGVSYVDGKPYAFNKDGVSLAVPGTPIFDGKKYWCYQDGSLGSGWFKLTNWKMYFDPETFEAAIGRAIIDDKKYLFNSDGVCYTDPRTDLIDGKKYWINSDGSIQTGWVKLGNMTLYFKPDTWEAAIGNITIDGLDYIFNNDGVLVGGNPSPLDPKPEEYTIDLGNGQTTTVTGYFDDECSAEILRLLNEYRVENGLHPLTTNNELTAGSRIRGYEISEKFDHVRPNGEDCFTVADRISGENIAAYYASAEDVMAGWKRSSGHNANMLSPYHSAVGIQTFYKYEDGNYRPYYVQLFGY